MPKKVPGGALMKPADVRTARDAAALIGQRYRLYWPRRHGKQPDFWVWVVIEDVLSSYYGRWDAIVRPADPANGYGQARVWLSKLETGP